MKGSNIQVLSEETATNYVKYIFENYMFWKNVSYKKDEDSNIWVFSGIINYNDQEQKIIKVIDLHNFTKLLKISLKVKKGYNIDYIDVFNRDGINFKIKYNLVNEYSRKRKK